MEQELKLNFFYAGICTLGITIFILIFILIAFDNVFTIFHSILFPQGNWIFEESSLLIQTFPEEFFIKIAEYIFLLSLFWGSIFILPFLSSKYVKR